MTTDEERTGQRPTATDATQFAPPRRTIRHVPRHRLLEVIGSTPGGGLCAVTGGPGFGKTELLADWAARTTEPAAWLTATPSDNDPSRFWRMLAASCRRAESSGSSGEGVQSLAGFRREILESRPDEPWWILIDDAHLLVEEEIRADLASLVGGLGPATRLLVASRVELSWSLARLRAQGVVIDIRERALAFDRAEVEALVVQSALQVPDALIDRLVERTEGWAAGVQLAVRAAQEREDPVAHLEALRGHDRSIADYLLEEALDRQPEAHRRFLLATSILDRLCGPLCDAVTGVPGRARLLAELERSHVLVARLEGTEEAWYRYHPLFAELLRAELDAEAPDLASSGHHRAATWFESTGDVDRAVRHFVAAGDLDEAARVVREHEDEHFRLGEVALVQAWYSLLPEMPGSDPDEQLLRLSWASIGADDPPEVWGPALDRLRGRRPPTARAVWLQAQVDLIDAQLAAGVGNAPATQRHAVAVLDAVDLGRAADELPTVAYATILAARAAVWNGAPGAARERVEGLLGDAAAGDAFWVRALEAVRSYVDVHLGSFDAALRWVDRSGQRADGGREVGALEASLARVIALRSVGRVPEAVAAIEAARSVAGATNAGAPFRVLLAVEESRAHLALGDLDAAGAALSGAEYLPRFDYGRTKLAEALGDWRQARSNREGVTDLTRRELDVLALLPTRLTLQEIADDLFVSANTVKTHVKSIYAKLQVSSRDEATRRADQLRLLADR